MDDAARIKFDNGPATCAWQQGVLLYEKFLDAKQRQEVKTVVVVTHTVPIREGLVWKSDERWNLQNGSFANLRMRTLITCAQSAKITTWCLDTATSADFTWNEIRFVNSSRGCPGEKRWHGPMSIQP